MNGSASDKDKPIIIRVKFKRSPIVAEVNAASFESDETYLRAKDGNAMTIAAFLLDKVAGWWVQPDTNSISLAERIQQARGRVAIHKAEQGRAQIS
jgi:hypothetical protein